MDSRVWVLFYEEDDSEGLHTTPIVIEIFWDEELALRVCAELTAKQNEFERQFNPYFVEGLEPK